MINIETFKVASGTSISPVNAPPLGVADWLSLAAAPTFAIMALLTAVLAGGPMDVLCAATHDPSPLTGMVAMYVLMSVFHAAPWLRLISTFNTTSSTIKRTMNPQEGEER